MSTPAAEQPPPSQISLKGNQALTFSFYALVIFMAGVQTFIMFRGLNSAAGMDQAQIAREIARGNGFLTKCIRPYAWQQMIAGGHDVPLTEMKDTFQPPLQPLIWAPVFKALEKWSAYEPKGGSAMYLLDRVIACIGVVWLLLALALTYFTMRRLFDERIAAVTGFILILCQPLWDVAVSGSPQALMLFLFALAFWAFAHALRRATAGESALGWLLVTALACGLMMLTHVLAIWIVLGFVMSAALLMPPRRLFSSLVIAVVPALALAGLMMRNYAVCGDMLGAAKGTLQALLIFGRDETLLRDFVSMNSPVVIDSILRKLAANLQFQVERGLFHLAFIPAAALAVMACVHRFRKPDVGAARWALALVWVFVLAGMLLIGLDQEQLDDNDLYCILVPAMTGFGVAMLAVFWTRLNLDTNLFLKEWGFAIVAIAVSIIPIFNKLPQGLRVGLSYQGRLANWPPYMPDRFAALTKLVENNEVLFCDAPWAIAWYADRTAVWMPVARKQFETMRAKTEANGEKVAGFVITPVSSKVERLTEVFDGTYREWADIIYRGPMLAFPQTEVRPSAPFEYNAVLPLMAVPLPETGGLNIMLCYYADRVRWDPPGKARTADAK